MVFFIRKLFLFIIPLLFTVNINANDCETARQRHFPELEGHQQSLIFTSKHLLFCKPGAPHTSIPTKDIDTLEAKPESNEFKVKVSYKDSDKKSKQATFIKKMRYKRRLNSLQRSYARSNNHEFH